MAGFEVKRSFVQDLDESGSIQLLGLETPTAEDFVDEEVEKSLASGILLPGELDDTGLIERGRQNAARRAFAKGRPQVEVVIEQIFRISTGYHPLAMKPKVRFKIDESQKGSIDKANPLDINAMTFHKDYDPGMFGFSVLWSVLPVKMEQLLVAGRGFLPQFSELTSYDYSDGPVVIAQRCFGQLRSTSKEEKGATWHRRHRTERGILAIADVTYAEDITVYSARREMRKRLLQQVPA